jgi:hypothetical protein
VRSRTGPLLVQVGSQDVATAMKMAMTMAIFALV